KNFKQNLNSFVAGQRPALCCHEYTGKVKAKKICMLEWFSHSLMQKAKAPAGPGRGFFFKITLFYD
ncbi:MAG TPA: hypothetical protein PKN17_05425, partial [Bacillota bacterium]|nr:hypothetical protein [Bacillota bacterium]